MKEGWRRENGEDPSRSSQILTKDVKLWPVRAASEKPLDHPPSDGSTEDNIPSGPKVGIGFCPSRLIDKLS